MRFEEGELVDAPETPAASYTEPTETIGDDDATKAKTTKRRTTKKAAAKTSKVVKKDEAVSTTDEVLHTILDPDELDRRLQVLIDDTSTAMEELGVNVLYRAMGLVTDLSKVIAEIGDPAKHPWRGSNLEHILPLDLERLLRTVDALLTAPELDPQPMIVKLMRHTAAFSVSQRDAIADELARLRKGNPEVESFFDTSAADPFFIRNLENVQGAEHDVIFVSVGYGPDEAQRCFASTCSLPSEAGKRTMPRPQSPATALWRFWEAIDRARVQRQGQGWDREVVR